MNEQSDSWFSPASPPPHWDPEQADPNRYVDPALQQVQYRQPAAHQQPYYGGYPDHQAAPVAYGAPAPGMDAIPAQAPVATAPGSESNLYEHQFEYQGHYDAGHQAPVEEKPAYEIPEIPETGWSAAPSRRRRWIGRILLLGVLAMQALLSLRLSDSASPEEAVNLVVGRQQYDHLLDGTAVTTDLVDRVPGSASLYPALAGAADHLGGLTAVRLLSLVFTLIGTALLYSVTRRMFNERVAASAAAAYAVLQSTVVVGYYASPDALALMLVAFAAWIVLYTDRAPVFAVLAAAPVAALAAAVNHTAVLVLPTLLLLAVHTAWPYKGPAQGILRGGMLGLATAALLVVTGVFTDISDSTLSRGQGSESTTDILSLSLQWSGLFLLLAIGGSIAWVRRERMNEAVDVDSVPGSPLRRAALGLTLCATAVLVPLLQAQLHTSAGMFRHIAFGLLLAAPMAGLGITRMIGAHFRHPQLGILVWVLMLALGISQSADRSESWASSGSLAKVLSEHVDGKGTYLTAVDGLPQYYLDAETSPGQWTSLREGKVADVTKGRYGLIVLDTTSAAAGSARDKAITQAIRAGGHYRLIAQLPHRDTGKAGVYRVYVKQ
ncbi:glycosyltransferase family 39 protein [Streptomyces sp. NPDC001536]|uniref:glycosyltransferase family 39 protein n=1 Tax=Streptomyces sp. NPDC001536 TaxID=3364583 RepID=UPI0036B711D2